MGDEHAIKRGDVPAPASAVDTHIITMAWLLRFSRVASAYHKLLQDWSNPPRLAKSAKQVEVQFRRWLAANPRASGTRFRFGNLARPVVEVDKHYAINFEVIDSPWYGDVDDFYAACGRVLFKIAISGIAERDKDKWRIAIDQVGIFLRDTYDFNGDQYLGGWGPDNFYKLASIAIPIDPREPQGWLTRNTDCYAVSNASFREYRGRFHHGGDFLIFSDVRQVALPRAVIVEFPA